MTSKAKHLKHIKLEGFKSIKKLDLGMRPINILIGANGSGKSNFISIFPFLRAIAQGKFQNYLASNGGADRFLHFGIKKTKRIKFDVIVKDNEYNASLFYNISDDNLQFEEESCSFDYSRNFPLVGRNGEGGLYIDYGEAGNHYVKEYTRTYLDKCQLYHFHDTGETALFKKRSQINGAFYLYNDANNIAAFLYNLKNSQAASHRKAYNNIIESIKIVAPFFHDFYLEPDGDEGKQTVLLQWTHANHDEPFSAHQLSDGTARFIFLATLLLQPEHLRPSTIILDEPELGLHPAALAVLADIIKSVAKTGQIICSTQSVTFANHFEPEDFIIVDQKDGVSSFSRPNRAKLESWLEDYQMGDIWQKNLIGGRPEW